jgi:hypothetical protein
LVTLEHDRERLERELVALRAKACPEGHGGIQAAVKSLMQAIQRFGEILATGAPEEQKAVVRAFLAEIRIEKTKRQAVLRWFRLPSVKLVELRGIEPLTPRLPGRQGREKRA